MTTIQKKVIAAQAALDGPLAEFMCERQKKAVRDLLHCEEREFFADKMIELAERIEKMPKTGEPDEKGDQAIVWIHYFGKGTSNWWIMERDIGSADDEVKGRQYQAFGLANWFGGPTDQDAELGYISLPEIFEAHVELDFHFEPRTLAELQKAQ